VLPVVVVIENAKEEIETNPMSVALPSYFIREQMKKRETECCNTT